MGDGARWLESGRMEICYIFRRKKFNLDGLDGWAYYWADIRRDIKIFRNVKKWMVCDDMVLLLTLRKAKISLSGWSGRWSNLYRHTRGQSAPICCGPTRDRLGFHTRQTRIFNKPVPLSISRFMFADVFKTIASSFCRDHPVVPIAILLRTYVLSWRHVSMQIRGSSTMLVSWKLYWRNTEAKLMRESYKCCPSLCRVVFRNLFVFTGVR